MHTLLPLFRILPLLALPLVAAPELEIRPEPAAWRFAHTDAQILAGADLFRLGQTPLGEKLRQQFLAAMGPELSRHVQRLLVSTAFAEDGSADSILILSGPLNAARIKQMAAQGKAPIKNYKGIEVILPPSGSADETHFAIVDSQTALLGTRLAVAGAIDRSLRTPRPHSETNPLFARAQDLGPEAEVWVLTEELPSGLGPDSWDPKAGLELVLTVKQDAGLAIGIALPDPTQVEAALRPIETDRFAKPPARYLLGAWLPKLASLRQAGGFVLSGALTEPATLEEFPALAAALGLPVKPAAPQPKLEITTLRPKPAPPVEPPPLRVRIEGLDNGPLEIPYQAKK
jgi:hypothetical protein